MHRDTLYGASPYELSLIVPFTDVAEASRGACRVRFARRRRSRISRPPTRLARTWRPGHGHTAWAFRMRRKSSNPDWRRAPSPSPSASARPSRSVSASCTANLSTRASSTRVSVDVRVVNSLAPVPHGRGVRADYYEPLSAAPVTRLAQRYPDLAPDD